MDCAGIFVIFVKLLCACHILEYNFFKCCFVFVRFVSSVQVTPSSKCVGDLALYLVTRGLKASDVTDPAKKGQVDFPDSVVGLLEGRLGFPHKGFPEEVCIYSTSVPARGR